MAASEVTNMIMRLGFDDGGTSAGIENIAEKMALVRSSMKATASQFGHFGDESEKLRRKQEDLSQLYELQGSKIEQLKKKYEVLAREKGENSKEALQLATVINREVTNHNQLERALRSTTLQINTQNSAWTRAGNSLQEYGERLQSTGNKMSTIGKVGFAAITAPVSALGVMAVKSAADVEKAQGKIAASLNLTKKEAAEVNKVTREMWLSGFGESMEEVNQGVIDTRKNLQNLKGDQLELATKRANILKEVFEYEIPESTRAAKALMDNYGVDVGKSFDLITVAAQKGGDYSNELLDTISEYSSQFSSAGISIEGMFNIMLQGAKNGAWNMDKVGDAVKEFNIRAQDGSKSTVNAFRDIGLDAEKMGTAIAEGGEKGQKAFMATVSAIAAVKDPLDRDAAGVALFGTMWEDLRGKVVTSLDPTKDMLGEVEGATEKAGKAIKDNFNDRAVMAFRKLMSNLLPIGEILLEKIEPALDKAGDAVDRFTKWFQGLTPSMQNTIVIAGLLAAAFPPVIIALGLVVSSIGTVTGALGRGAVAFGRYRAEAALARTSTSQLAAANTAAAAQMNISNAAVTRNTRGLRGLRGASGLAGTAMMSFGGKWGSLLGVATMFAPEIAKGAQSLFNFRGGARVATTATSSLGAGTAQTAGRFAGFGVKALGVVKSLGNVARVASVARVGMAAFGGPVGLAVTGVSLLAEGGYKLYKHLKEEQIPALEDFGEKVSESTTKSVLGYKKLNDQATAQLNQLNWSGQKVSKETADNIVKNFNTMGDQIKQSIETKGNQSFESLRKFMASSKSLSQKEQEAILNNVKKKQNEQVKAVSDGEAKIKAILTQASSEKRNLTQKEKTTINNIQKSMMTTAVKTMSKSEVEQKAIMSKLQTESKSITARQAADTIKNSIKAKEGAVKEADDKYNKTVAAVVRERDETGSISTKQANKLIKEAKRQRDDSVSAAKDMHKKVVKEAKKQAGDHADEINTETGEVKTGWEKMMDIVNSAWNWIQGLFGGGDKKKKKSNPPKLGTDGKGKYLENRAYAKGTPATGHPGGLAVTSEKGRELIHEPGVGTYVSGNSGPELRYLRKGSSVLPNKETERVLKRHGMPGYENGVGDYFDWIMKGPKFLWNKATEKFGLNDGLLPSWFTNVSGSPVEAIAKLAFSGVDSLIGSIGSFFGGGNATENVKRWVAQAISIAGISPSFAGALQTIAMKESGGNPTVVNNWDSNAKAGHPSQGLMQFIPSTFAAHAKKGFTDIRNPVHQILAAINYLNSRYGGINRHPGLVNMSKGGKYIGYAAGGVSPGAGGTKLAALNERGYDEHIITTDPSYRERSLAIWARAGAELGVNPQSAPSGMNLEPMTSRQDTTNALLQEQNELLREIVSTGSVIKVGEKTIAKVMNKIGMKQLQDKAVLMGGW
ncbi:phage tail tape measure protein [Bacillus safensis]|uniref:phage tail tape measure protein n=1 Tax=Bacillus safensis TaxID=561879 RepID=UPI0038397B5B